MASNQDIFEATRVLGGLPLRSFVLTPGATVITTIVTPLNQGSIVRVVATGLINLKFTTDTTTVNAAAATDMLVPANLPEYFNIGGGTYVSFRNTTAATISVGVTEIGRGDTLTRGPIKTSIEAP